MARQTTKTVQGELVTNPIKVVTEITVSTSDVMAIGMVEVESRLEERIKDLTAQMKAKEKAAKETQERINKAKQERVEEYFAQAKKALADALKIAGLASKVTVSISHGSSITDDVETYNGCLLVSQPRGGYSDSVNHEFVANSEHVALTKEYGQLNTEASKLRDQLVDAKLELSKLPSLERKYRAQLAKAQLSQSEQGRELLAQMQEHTAGDLTRLKLTAK